MGASLAAAKKSLDDERERRVGLERDRAPTTGEVVPTTRSEPTPRVDDASEPSSTQLQSDLQAALRQLEQANRELEAERADAQQLEDELADAHWELSRSQREVKNIQRQGSVLSAQQVLTPAVETPHKRTNHAACWVRQCVLQWFSNQLINERNNRRAVGAPLGAHIIRRMIVNVQNDMLIQMWMHWRAATHINRTARWHMQLKEDVSSFMGSSHAAWKQFTAIAMARATSYHQAWA